MDFWYWLPWALLILTVLYMHRDRGHRCFGVPNDEAAIAIGRVLRRSRLRELFTFDMESRAGRIVQTLFGDGRTVLIQIKGTPVPKRLSEEYGPCAVSLTTLHPQRKALQAAETLRNAGFIAEVCWEFVPSLGDKFILLRSNAFIGWDLAYRHPVPFMGKPSQNRRITTH